MATRTDLVSDLSGEPDASTEKIGFRDVWFEIDLTARELDELERELSTYLAAARKVGGAKHAPRRNVPDTTPAERAAIRGWARENGHELSPYGQIPNALYQAYIAAEASS